MKILFKCCFLIILVNFKLYSSEFIEKFKKKLTENKVKCEDGIAQGKAYILPFNFLNNELTVVIATKKYVNYSLNSEKEKIKGTAWKNINANIVDLYKKFPYFKLLKVFAAAPGKKALIGGTISANPTSDQLILELNREIQEESNLGINVININQLYPFHMFKYTKYNQENPISMCAIVYAYHFEAISEDTCKNFLGKEEMRKVECYKPFYYNLANVNRIISLVEEANLKSEISVAEDKLIKDVDSLSYENDYDKSTVDRITPISQVIRPENYSSKNTLDKMEDVEKNEIKEKAKQVISKFTGLKEGEDAIILANFEKVFKDYRLNRDDESNKVIDGITLACLKIFKIQSQTKIAIAKKKLRKKKLFRKK